MSLGIGIRRVAKHGTHNQKDHGNWADNFFSAVLGPATAMFNSPGFDVGRYRSPEGLARSLTDMHVRVFTDPQSLTSADIDELTVYSQVTGYRPAELDQLIAQQGTMQNRFREYGIDYLSGVRKHDAPIHPGTGTGQEVHDPGGLGISTTRSTPHPELGFALPSGLPPLPEGTLFTEIGRLKHDVYEWVSTVTDRVKELEQGSPEDVALAEEYTDTISRVFDAGHKMRAVRQADVQRRIALGEITAQEAYDMGWHFNGGTIDKVQPLPPRLFHVTTAASEIRANGIKTRDELDQSSGKGLGGGPSDTISFTSDIGIAAQIQSAMVERHTALNNYETEIPRMIAEAKEEGWWYTVGDLHKRYPDGPEGEKRLNDLFTGRHEIGNAAMPHKMDWAMSEWEDRLDPETHPSLRYDPMHPPKPIGSPRGTTTDYYDKYEVRWSETAQMSRIGDFLDSYAAYREAAGGPMNPLFFSTDDHGFANSDISELEILEFRPKPNAHGYEVSALGEWRTWSGDAVELVY